MDRICPWFSPIPRAPQFLLSSWSSVELVGDEGQSISRFGVCCLCHVKWDHSVANDGETCLLTRISDNSRQTRLPTNRRHYWCKNTAAPKKASFCGVHWKRLLDLSFGNFCDCVGFIWCGSGQQTITRTRIRCWTVEMTLVGGTTWMGFSRSLLSQLQQYPSQQWSHLWAVHRF